MQDHRKLDVWARAHAHCIAVRRATGAFPRRGYAPLHSQTTRAAESILFNIIEGCGTRTPKDFAKFLDSSIKSSKELEGQLDLAKDYGVMKLREWERLARETVEIRRMLCGLRATVLRKSATTA
ncbi:MAG: four helix bundle protein [Gemmatimonadaceae bacterium]